MPPIDPERLLRTLSPLLEPTTGAIKSPNEVDKLYGLMSKFSKKLVSKTTYINILKATPRDVLDLFMQRGGWDMICGWAADALACKNWAILKEISELLFLTPATITRLKDNELPKIIKTLSKECENEATRLAACQVYEKWMVIAQQKEAPPTYIGADGQVISLDDANLAAYELHPHTSSVPPSTASDNQIILEADPTSGAFDLTQYIDAQDLNNLETDFNPDDFNSTLDDVHLMEGTEMVDGEFVIQDGPASVIHLPSNCPETQETLSQLGAPLNLQSTDPTKAPLCLVVRDGKRFLLRLQVGQSETVPVAMMASGEEVEVPEKKPKSPGKPKMPSSGKPKMPSSGKPPLKAYEAKSKKVNTEDSSKGFKGSPAKEKDKGKEKGGDKEKDRDRKIRDKEADKKKSMLSASRIAAEAKRRVEEEKAEKLRVKVLEQKRIRDQRKEELAKKQKEIDDETLKALKLTALPPIKPQPFAKIPKRTTSFADMIAIPGSNSKEKEAKKGTTVSKSSKDGSSSASSATNQKEPSKGSSDDAAGGTRKSRPKVFMSGKSRSLGLLEDMEQSQAKGKEKEVKEKEVKEADIELPALGSKNKKRTSAENSESPASKKAKKEPTPKKVVGIQESPLFMEALSSSVTTTRNMRSSKRRSSDAKEPQTPTTPPVKSPGGQEEVKPVVFNFYRDTLGDSAEEKNGEEGADQHRSNGSDEREDDDGADDRRADAFVPAEGEGMLKSALVIHRPRNRPKKSVRWVEEAELKKFHYFEMDETERVNVTRMTKSFTEMKQTERSEERKVLKRNLRKDNMEEKIPWVSPSRIVFTTPPHEMGQYSLEVNVQNERESGILEVFYFSKTQIPDTATEPDEPPIKNQDDPSICKAVPFEDINGVTAVNNFVFKPREMEPLPSVMARGVPPSTSQFPGSTMEPPKIITPNDYIATYLQQQQAAAAQQQIPTMDITQIQAQYNLWNTLSQVPDPATVAAVAAAGIPPGSDIWNQMQLAAGIQQAAAALSTGMPNYQLNLPYGYPQANPQGGYSTNPGMVPAPVNSQPPADQFGGASNSNRFIGPPPNRGGGMPPRRENRGGRPNRWDDRGNGNYDNERRRDDFRRGGGSDGDRNRNNNDNRDRDRGRGNRGGDRGGAGGRDRDFQRTERNRAGTPRTVLCKFFQQGCCKVGEECDFLHPGINGPSRASRFTNRFPSPPPGADQSSRSVGRVESPLKSIGDDDNWEVPPVGGVNEERRGGTESFDHPPSSPNASPPRSSTTSEVPRTIPINKSEPMES